MNALIIDTILIPFEDNINAQALQHESTMVDVYTKMKPDSFKSQLQAVLTALYEDIKGVQGASGCPKTKILKRRFEDHEDAGTTPQGRGWHRGRERCRRSPGPRRGSGCSPARRPLGACSCACVCLICPQPAGKAAGLDGKRPKG